MQGDWAEAFAAILGAHPRVGGRLRAVAWRAGESELGRRLLSREGALHVVGRLKPDDYNGREGVELEIEDAADPRMCA